MTTTTTMNDDDDDNNNNRYVTSLTNQGFYILAGWMEWFAIEYTIKISQWIRKLGWIKARARARTATPAPSVGAEWVSLLIHTSNIPRLNFSMETGHGQVSSFYSVPPEKNKRQL